MNFIALIPKSLRQAIYWKLADELQQIDSRTVADFAWRVLTAAARVLKL